MKVDRLFYMKSQEEKNMELLKYLRWSRPRLTIWDV